jgi:N-sulfoglucosamine sulfohydrolase
MPRQKREIHESGTRVPTFIRLPNKQFAGTRINNMVSLIDLGPTMLSLVGIQTPHNMHGKAFMGKFKAPDQKYVFGRYDRRAGTLDMARYVQSDSFLYIRNYYPELPWYGFTEYRNKKCRMMEDILSLRNEGGLNEQQMQWFRETKPVEELFNVKEDPHSMNNLAGNHEYQDVLVEMRKVHQRWMLETKDIELFPEAVQTSMEKKYGMTMYEIMRDYPVPLEKIIKINQLWTGGGKNIPKLVDALSDTLSVNRYHAAIGGQVIFLEGGEYFSIIFA